MAVVRFETIPSILRPTKVLWDYRPAAKIGPMQQNGQRQTVESDAGHWMAALTYDIFNEDEIREFRGFMVKCASGGSYISVPTYDRRQAPWPTGYDFETPVTVTNVGNARFSDSTGIGQRIIDVRANAAASEGATTMDVVIYRAGTLKRGQYFSVTEPSGYERLHLITDIPTVVSSTVRRLRFLPMLRANVAAGAVLDFANARCTMRLVQQPDGGGLELEAWYSANPKLMFREAFEELTE